MPDVLATLKLAFTNPFKLNLNSPTTRNQVQLHYGNDLQWDLITQYMQYAQEFFSRYNLFSHKAKKVLQPLYWLGIWQENPLTKKTEAQLAANMDQQFRNMNRNTRLVIKAMFEAYLQHLKYNANSNLALTFAAITSCVFGAINDYPTLFLFGGISALTSLIDAFDSAMANFTFGFAQINTLSITADPNAAQERLQSGAALSGAEIPASTAPCA